jgi:hypothetical protein
MFIINAMQLSETIPSHRTIGESKNLFTVISRPSNIDT